MAARSSQARASSLFGLLGVCQRAVHERQAFRDLPHIAEAFCQLTREQIPVQVKRSLGKLPERGAHESRAGGTVPTLDEEHSFQASAPHAPGFQPVCHRQVPDELHIAVRCRKIAGIDDRTRRMTERVQQRKYVILRAGVIDDFFRHAHRLIGESLRPENARVEAMDHDSLIH
jgi:hypothetical protein